MKSKFKHDILWFSNGKSKIVEGPERSKLCLRMYYVSVMLCYCMLCYVILCCIMSCYVMLCLSSRRWGQKIDVFRSRQKSHFTLL